MPLMAWNTRPVNSSAGVAKLQEYGDRRRLLPAPGHLPDWRQGSQAPFVTHGSKIVFQIRIDDTLASSGTMFCGTNCLEGWDSAGACPTIDVPCSIAICGRSGILRQASGPSSVATAVRSERG
jgi:hypothetical protein